MVGHNPGLTQLAQALAADNTISLKPCDVCGLEFDLESWNEVDLDSAIVSFRN